MMSSDVHVAAAGTDSIAQLLHAVAAEQQSRSDAAAAAAPTAHSQAAAPSRNADASGTPAWLAELMAKHGIQLDPGVVQQLVEHGVHVELFPNLTFDVLEQMLPWMPFGDANKVLRLAAASARDNDVAWKHHLTTTATGTIVQDEASLRRVFAVARAKTEEEFKSALADLELHARSS